MRALRPLRTGTANPRIMTPLYLLLLLNCPILYVFSFFRIEFRRKRVPHETTHFDFKKVSSCVCRSVLRRIRSSWSTRDRGVRRARGTWRRRRRWVRTDRRTIRYRRRRKSARSPFPPAPPCPPSPAPRVVTAVRESASLFYSMSLEQLPNLSAYR